MSRLLVEGGHRLEGAITVQGAKNSVLPILAATLLARDTVVLERCPRLRDVDASIRILKALGCDARWQGEDLLVDTSAMTGCAVPDALMREMRSSAVFLGAILARCGQTELSYPGGCDTLWDFVRYYTPDTTNHDMYAFFKDMNSMRYRVIAMSAFCISWHTYRYIKRRITDE